MLKVCILRNFWLRYWYLEGRYVHNYIIVLCLEPFSQPKNTRSFSGIYQSNPKRASKYLLTLPLLGFLKTDPSILYHIHKFQNRFSSLHPILVKFLYFDAHKTINSYLKPRFKLLQYFRAFWRTHHQDGTGQV